MEIKQLIRLCVCVRARASKYSHTQFGLNVSAREKKFFRVIFRQMSALALNNKRQRTIASVLIKWSRSRECFKIVYSVFVFVYE